MTMNDNHDDGLVHSHNYACSERGRMAHRPLTTRPEEYDDGLVHSHNYACGDRGQPAHR
jgi:hypothetical protein